MLGRIVEIESGGRRLHLERGFLAIDGPDGTLGRVPLDDIEAVILSHPAASLTSQAISALSERGTPIVISGNDFKPCALVLPIDGHFAQGDRIEAQASASLPLRKRLWADIVTAKILAQAGALDRVGALSNPVRSLTSRVRSGDPQNTEAQAAQRYFPSLFGKGFVRGSGQGPVNGMLNYGYTVLRAATARAIVAAGLHPSLSIMHRSRGEALRLADDVMEPFRPAVDLAVWQLAKEGTKEVDATAKAVLVRVLQADYQTSEGRSPLSVALVRLCTSLAQVFLKERKSLSLPISPIPLASTPRETTGEEAE
jgi:CRISPR-associated protein Cas1